MRREKKLKENKIGEKERESHEREKRKIAKNERKKGKMLEERSHILALKCTLFKIIVLSYVAKFLLFFSSF